MALDRVNGILEDIAGEIGYTATASLVDWFGGGSLYIPATADDDHPIKRVIGAPAFTHLVREYGSQVLAIPLECQRERNRVKREIAGLIMRGMSEKVVAGIVSMSDRQVHNIRVELEEAKIIPLIFHSGMRRRKNEAAGQGELIGFEDADGQTAGADHAIPAF